MATQRANRHMAALLPQTSMLCRCAEGPQLYRPARDDGPYATQWPCTVVELTVPGSLHCGGDWLGRGVNGAPVTPSSGE